MRMKVAQQENKGHMVARTQAPPQSMSTTRAGPPNETAALLNWQQTQGNHFLQRRLNARLARLFSGGVGPQAQLTVGPPNDRFEQEAEQVARRVVAGEQVARIPRMAAGGLQPTTDLESAINRARGGGQPLEAGLQQSMGQAMGADFSGVKVHTDAQADQLNRSIQAKAFTTGQDVFFRQGAYAPGESGGTGVDCP